MRGIGVGECVLPVDLPEGRYTLTVSEVNERFNETKRPFQVRRRKTARFHKEVQLDRDSYGPGDTVRIRVKANPIAGAQGAGGALRITPQVEVDGQTLALQTQNQWGGDASYAEFNYLLPAQLFRGVGKVTISCSDGGEPETVVRALPIALRDLQVELNPEGGELIAGVPNRVYFQARTPANRPADFEGVILDGKTEITRVRTFSADDATPGLHQGLGSFTFTPQANRRYQLRIDAPIGIERLIPLPLVKASGVVLSTPQGVVDNEIRVQLTSAPTPRELFVGAYCRGRMLDGQTVHAPANQAVPVTLRPQAAVGGVYRITVFEKTPGGGATLYRPLAERLVYRRSQQRVDVQIDGTRPSYEPGAPVDLRLHAMDEKKAAVPAALQWSPSSRTVRPARTTTKRYAPCRRTFC